MRRYRSIVKQCGGGFKYGADNPQIYSLPDKENCSCLNVIFQFFEDVKAWTTLQFLNFNESINEIFYDLCI